MDKVSHHSHFPAVSPMPTCVPLSPSFPVPGEPGLKAPKTATVQVGENFKLSCHFPCKYYSYEKYWCKWSNKGCKTLPSQDEGHSQALVDCDQKSQIISVTLNPVSKTDEGWYWCGVKDGLRYGETVAVYVAVEERVKGKSLRTRSMSPGDTREGSCLPAPPSEVAPRFGYKRLEAGDLTSIQSHLAFYKEHLKQTYKSKKKKWICHITAASRQVL